MYPHNCLKDKTGYILPYFSDTKWETAKNVFMNTLTSGGVNTSDFQPRPIFPPGQTLPSLSNILPRTPNQYSSNGQIESNLAKWP